MTNQAVALTGAPLPVTDSRSRGRRLHSPAGAAALSMILPGLGQWAAGFRRRGFLWAVPAAVTAVAVAMAALAAIADPDGPLDWLSAALSPDALRTLVLLDACLLVYHLAAMADAWWVTRARDRRTGSAGRAVSAAVLSALMLATLAAHAGAGWVTFRASESMAAIFIATGPDTMQIPEPGFTEPPAAVSGDPDDADASPSAATDAPGSSPGPLSPPPTGVVAGATSPASGSPATATGVPATAGPTPRPTGAAAPPATAAPGEASAQPTTAAPSQASIVVATAAPTSAPTSGATSSPEATTRPTATRRPAATAGPAPSPTAVPGWARDGRLNLLLLGSDAGPDRWSLRTDTILVLSVDVRTGHAAFFGIPRNLIGVPLAPEDETSFPGNHFPGMINELYTYAMAHPDGFPGGDARGFRAVAGAVQELVGVRLDGMALVNLAGFVRLVNALGGLWISVPYRLVDTNYPLEDGTGHIAVEFSPGCQHLDGRMALAYARSRQQDSDYGRMHRQQLVLLALRRQVDPLAMLPKIPELLDAAGATLWTTLTPRDLAGMARLAARVRVDQVQSFFFVPHAYPEYLDDPEIARIRSVVQDVFANPWPARPSNPASAVCGP